MATPEPGQLISRQRADELSMQIDIELASHSDTQEALQRFTELVVPELADWASIGYQSLDGEDRYVVATLANPSNQDLYPAAGYSISGTLPAEIYAQLSSGQPAVIDNLYDTAAPQFRYRPEARAVYEKIKPGASLAIPLPVRGNRPGVLMLSMAESKRQYSVYDRGIAIRIARQLQFFLEGTVLHSQVERFRSARDLSAGLLDTVIDQSPIGLAVIDSKLHFKRVNETFVEMVSSTENSHWAVSLNQMSPQLAEQIASAITAVFERDSSTEVEVSLESPKAPNGFIHLIAHIYGVRGRSDAVESAGIALLDVTARVEAESARQRSDSQLRIALDAARMGLFRWDTTNDTMHWSATNAVLLGIDPLAEQSYDAWLDAIHEDDQARVRAMLEDSARTGTACETEYRVVHPDESLHWILLKAQPTSDAGVVEMVGVQLDVTEQRTRTDEQAKFARLQAQAGEQAVRMQRVSSALSRALTTTQVCDVLTSEGSSALGAPRSAIYLLDESGDTMQIARTHGVDDKIRHTIVETISRAEQLPINDVISTGEPLVLENFDSLKDRYPQLIEFARSQGIGSSAIVRLESAGHVYGAWTLTWYDQRKFDDGELMILLTLAVQGGKALERAQLFERERLISTALQRTLLPAELPELNGATVARRYVPGAQDIEVGGDWYDVVPLSPSRVALVIGDVSGHNVDSAAVMGQIRNAIRSYAWEGHQAGGVVEATNKLLCGLEPGVLATCCFVELNLEDGIASVALAGHPPPVIRRADGASEMTEMVADPPLGTDQQQLYAQSSLFLGPGDMLVLYTDGLVETRDLSLGSGLTYLARAIAASGDLDPDQMANFLLGELTMAEREDDVTLLVLRYEPETYNTSATQRVVRRQLASTPASAGVARRFANDVLSDWGVIELSDQVSLCVSELVTNALIHTATDVELVLRLTKASVRVEVIDQSERLPVVRDGSQGDTTGRGLTIVEAMADDWGIESAGNGKAVWFQLAL